jgi:hypothetical protein
MMDAFACISGLGSGTPDAPEKGSCRDMSQYHVAITFAMAARQEISANCELKSELHLAESRVED